MRRQDSRTAISVQDDNASTYRLVGHEDPKTQKPAIRGVMMDDSAMEIGFAASIMMLPMLILSGVLLALVFMHQMPYHDSTYSENNGAELPLGSAYYVNYSATTIVYIASLSSTLATLLVSIAMILFSYSLARAMAKNSDNGNALHLPSPFQLQLLIRIIDGRLTALWSYLLYTRGGKQRKIATARMLWHAVIVLAALVLYA